MSIITTIYDLNDVNVTLSKKKFKIPRYACFQQGNKNMIDSRDVFMTMNQSESWFFWSMDKIKDKETNEVIFSRAHCPKEKGSYYTTVIAKLIDKRLILRLKQNHYLINPNVILPTFNSYEKVQAKWVSLGGKLPTM